MIEVVGSKEETACFGSNLVVCLFSISDSQSWVVRVVRADEFPDPKLKLVVGYFEESVLSPDSRWKPSFVFVGGKTNIFERFEGEMLRLVSCLTSQR